MKNANKTSEPIRIQELADFEIEKFEKEKWFASLRPVECSSCGAKEPENFKRRFFHVSNIHDETDEQILRTYMKNTHKINEFLHRSVDKKYMVEAGVGQK